MTDRSFAALADAVQYNCHISDARHGADYSLCVYLMKMREYYRWEKHLPYGAALEKDRVGDWLAARERLWEALEGEDLRPLPIGGENFDPFDTDSINARLAPQGLVYSAGLGNGAKPHFFLGGLECTQREGGCAVYVSAEEYARDLAAPPAMHLGHTIYLRRESLRRVLWEKLESWRWSRPDNALGRAFACYDFESDLEEALDAMTDREIKNVLLHEQGEYAAGRLLGDVEDAIGGGAGPEPARQGGAAGEACAPAESRRASAQRPAGPVPGACGERDDARESGGAANADDDAPASAPSGHWSRMVLDLAHTPAEIAARAVRDHLADCLVTLPALAELGDPASLHFYVGNLTAMRRELFPGLLAAYGDWWERAGQGASGDTRALREAALQGRAHWETVARGMLDLHRRHGPAAAGPIADWVRGRPL